MKVLHCPTSVGGNAWGLASAERKIGINSTVLIYKDTWLGFPYDINLHFDKTNKLKRHLLMWDTLIKAIKDYDIIHFNFGQSLISNERFRLFHLDMAILKKFRKGIVITYQGSDVRQIDYCVKHYEISPYSQEDISYADNIKREKVKIANKYADRIYALNPDLLNVLPERSEFRPYSKLDLSKWSTDEVSDYNKEILTIAHAPTNRKIKGTNHIIDTINRLKDEGYPIEFLLIENIPNDRVMEIYKKADLFIDQLLIGWYGGVALEFMALSKPVFAYIRDEDLKYIPIEMCREIPIINSNPNNLYNNLKYCLKHRDYLQEKAIGSRKYVEKWHNPIKIAQRMKVAYEEILNKR